MTISRNTLCIGYALIGALAFVGTWGNVLDLLREQGFVEGTLHFWRQTLVNGPSRFITVDLLFLALSVTVWMTLEARRLAMPWLWLYVALGLLVAISLAVPLFLIHRERRLAALEPGSSAGTPRSLDLLALGLLAIAVTAFGILALSLAP